MGDGYGLNCIPQIYTVKSSRLIPQNVTIFRNKLFEEIKLNEVSGGQGGIHYDW